MKILATWSASAINSLQKATELKLTSTQSNFLAVRPSINDETVYQITQTIYENLTQLQEFHQATQEMSLDKAISGLTTPLHPGAIKYYQEQGLEIPANLLTT